MAVRPFAFPRPYVQRIAVVPAFLPVSSCSDAGDGLQLAATGDCTQRVGSEDCTRWAGTLLERTRCRSSQIQVAEPAGMAYIDCAGPFQQDVPMAYQAMEVLVGKTENGAGKRRSWRLEGLAHAHAPVPVHVPVPAL